MFEFPSGVFFFNGFDVTGMMMVMMLPLLFHKPWCVYTVGHGVLSAGLK